MRYCGVDISKDKFDAELIKEGAEKGKRRQFENNPSGVAAFVSWLKNSSDDPIHVCMEATGKLWEPLAETLLEAGVKTSVVNPLKIKGFASSELRRSKTDSIDAQVIGRFCKVHNPPVWVAPASLQKQIRDNQRYLCCIKEMRTQEKNRLQAGVLGARVKAEIEAHIAYLDQRVEAMEAEILELVRSDKELSCKYDLLDSIKGVGQATAVTFLSEIIVENFGCARDLEVFCGIAPRSFESGSSVHRRKKISKVGNRWIRAILFMPALSAKSSNPQMKEFAQRLKNSGKPKKVVICAVMRKLLRLMYVVLTTGKPYDPTYCSVKPLAA